MIKVSKNNTPLTAAAPTPFTEGDVATQMSAIGLSCSELSGSQLQSYVDNVVSNMPSGSVQAMAIKEPADSGLVDVATGNWAISETAQGYGPNLEIIQSSSCFKWLYDNRATNGFLGTMGQSYNYNGDESNAAAIMEIFTQIGVKASETLVKGLDHSSVKAVFSNVIRPLAGANLSNFSQSSNRVVYLVENYDPETDEAAGIGVLTINWSLSIEDYKRKSKDGGDTHPTSLEVSAYSVLYTDIGSLCTDFNSVVKHFDIPTDVTC